MGFFGTIDEDGPTKHIPYFLGIIAKYMLFIDLEG